MPLLIVRAVLEITAHVVSLNLDRYWGLRRKPLNLVLRGKQSLGFWERASELGTLSIFL